MARGPRTEAQPLGRDLYYTSRPSQAPAAAGIGLRIPPRDLCVWEPCRIEIDDPVEGVPQPTLRHFVVPPPSTT
jgi:hypothetical protein